MIIKEVLKSSIEEINKLNIEDASMKVKMLLSDILGKEKEYLLIHDNEELSQDVLDNFYAKLNRLKDEEPIQYILNKQEFMGFEFYVDENVLIPQPDTEILVEEVVDISKKINNNSNELRVLDMCTGSGAIAISLSKLIENVSVSASDISDGALNVAKENAIKNSVNIEFYKSDLFNDISIVQAKNSRSFVVSCENYLCFYTLFGTALDNLSNI